MSINLPEFTENMNKISALDDQPTIPTSELKAKFDEGGSAIKTYINSTLIPQIESQVGAEITSGVNEAKSYTDTVISGIDLDAENITYDNTSSELSADNVQDAIDELKTNVSSATSTANEKIKYSDFDISTVTLSGTLSPRGI